MVAIYGFQRERLYCYETYCSFRNPSVIMREMSMQNAVWWVDALALLSIFIGLRIVAYFVLRWRVHSTR